MAADDKMEGSRPAYRGSGPALRMVLASGAFSVPLDRVHHLAGFAQLAGEPEDYFRGWLMLRGDWIPVFDLNRVVCDQPTAENFGSRIVVVKTAPGASTPYLGMLAGGITDTVSANDAQGIEPLNLDAYLPMLYTMIPPGPADA